MRFDSLARDYQQGHRHDCAYVTATPRQILLHVAVPAGLVLLLFYRWDYCLFVVNCGIASFYLTVIVFRALATGLSLVADPTLRITPDRLGALADADLPVYTILIPLYHEKNLAESIVGSIRSLDYPVDKLDVKLLLEADDADTLAALRALTLPPCCEIIVVPDGQPKTKPRACDYGLRRARGDYCVVYDAEDRPDPDQLKKAALAFADQPPDVVCLQARLDYYNTDVNRLTRWFTVEYATTFGLYLPGLQVLGMVMPLGGTSNHFRTGVLQELDGWDPFNVTEDCDLGVRIYRGGYRTRMLDSTTWEEANARVGSWLRQRSRWVKGFFQTHLVHSRQSRACFKALGAWRFVGFLLTVGGSALMMVLNVVYWIVGACYGGLLIHGMARGCSLWNLISQGSTTVTRPVAFTIGNNAVRAWPLLYYGDRQDPLWSTVSVVFFVITIVLLLANLLFVLVHVAACLKTRRPRLLGYALTMPLYWILASLGAWKGFIQLLHAPHYWEKTEHGLDEET